MPKYRLNKLLVSITFFRLEYKGHMTASRLWRPLFTIRFIVYAVPTTNVYILKTKVKKWFFPISNDHNKVYGMARAGIKRFRSWVMYAARTGTRLKLPYRTNHAFCFCHPFYPFYPYYCDNNNYSRDTAICSF